MPTATRPRKRAAKPNDKPAEPQMSEEEKQKQEKQDRDDALKKAYSIATSRLRDENRTEFDRIYSEEATKLGVTYTPKPTPEQKAKADILEKLEKYPGLAEELGIETGVPVDPPLPEVPVNPEDPTV